MIQPRRFFLKNGGKVFGYPAVFFINSVDRQILREWSVRLFLCLLETSCARNLKLVAVPLRICEPISPFYASMADGVEQPVFPSSRFQNALKRAAEEQSSPTQRFNVRDNMAVKRIRPWDYCDSIEDLKRMLSEKDEELLEKDNQLAALERKLKSAKKSLESSPAGADGGGPSKAYTPKQLETQANKLRRSIQSQVLNQMTYKPSTKCGTAKLVPVEISDVQEIVLKALFGETLMEGAANGPKQLKVVVTNEEVEMIFNRSLSKSLRFGAKLELAKGLTFVYHKQEGALKVTGAYGMVK